MISMTPVFKDRRLLSTERIIWSTGAMCTFAAGPALSLSPSAAGRAPPPAAGGGGDRGGGASDDPENAPSSRIDPIVHSAPCLPSACDAHLPSPEDVILPAPKARVFYHCRPARQP